MSRKKNKRLQFSTPTVSTITTPQENEETTTPSKKEQIANMLFNDFLKKTMKVFNYLENDFVTITPYMEKDSIEKSDGSDIVCYEIVPKSNQNIVVYIDDKDIYASLKGTGVKINDDETAFLAANILGYIKGHCPIAA